MKSILRFCSLAGLVALLLAPLARAQTVNIQFGIGTLYDFSGVLIPEGSLVLLIADTGQNGFAAFQEGSLLTEGSFLNGDDQILGRAFTDQLGEAAAQISMLALASNPSPGAFTNLTTGDRLGIIWFSSLTESSTQLTAGDRYGFISLVSTPEGDAWTVPGQGQSIGITFRTQESGGTFSETDAYANLIISAIPEPSAYVTLAGLAALGAIGLRRRKHRAATSRNAVVD